MKVTSFELVGVCQATKYKISMCVVSEQQDKRNCRQLEVDIFWNN